MAPVSLQSPDGHADAAKTPHPRPYDPSRPIQPQEHDVEDIVDAVAQMYRSLDVSTRQKEICDVHEWLEEWDDLWCDSDYMEEGMHLLSKLLSTHEIPGLEFVWDITLRDSENCYGITRLSDNGESALIFLDERDCHRELGVRDSMSAFLGTLLHEICHALLELMVCDGKSKHNHQSCKDKYTRYSGEKGHGKAWFLLAAYVEAAAQSYLPELDIKLGVIDSTAEECKFGISVPDRADWIRLAEDLDRPGMERFISRSSSKKWQKLFKEAGLL